MIKYTEETHLKKAPDLITVFTKFPQDRFSPPYRIVFRYPGQKLSYLSFQNDEDASRFLTHFAKKCNLSSEEMYKKLIPDVVIRSTETEYRIVADEECITFHAEKNEYSDCYDIKDSGIQPYTHGIHVSFEDIKNIKNNPMDKK